MFACEMPLSPLSAPAPARPEAPASVCVRAPGRLHLGFLDPAGSLGRPFGSLGLVIEGFETVVELSVLPAGAGDDEVTAASPAAAAEIPRARQCLQRLRQHSGQDSPRFGALRLRLLQVLPAHAGFGSGTQLALAIGRAWALAQGLTLDSATLAAWLGRGLRSGIGIAGFDQGGLLLDGGPGRDGRPAPLLSRVELPADWRVLVVQDTAVQGLSGPGERQALAQLQPLPQAQAADICHQVLMRVLPGAATADFAAFAAGLTRMQQVLGDHFAPAQGGSAYTSPAVEQVVQCLAEAAAGASASPGLAMGQSSWGPTGFVILPSAAAAEAAAGRVRAAGLLREGLALSVVRARSRGASISFS